MKGALGDGVVLAVVSGIMNGSFTLPMRFLGRWDWEHVWSLFIAVSCLVMPAVILTVEVPNSWAILAGAPSQALAIAAVAGFAWGFGAIMFGQSVSAIGISLANTLVLAISSSLGSLLPMILLARQRLFEPEGLRILEGVAVAVIGIVFCGYAGHLREKAGGAADRGDLVGKARPLGVALLLATGSGVLSAVFNIGFALAQPVARYGQSAGLSAFASANLIWGVMLGAGSLANLGFCAYLFFRNRNLGRFCAPGGVRLYALSSLMALLWGGSIFVYGAAAQRLGSLGTSIGWPLSLAAGLLLANAIGISLGEWKHVRGRGRASLYLGITILLAAIVLLSGAGE
ncbi:MAG: L-rhamnose/proton symporter RhaT [Acidobacteriota bacterium]